MNSNDISYDGIESDAAINYNPSFGKICTGEQFRVLFTIMNTSSNYSLDHIKMKVIVHRSNQAQGQNAKPKEDILMNDEIKTLAPKQTQGFVFIFKVGYQDNYL